MGGSGQGLGRFTLLTFLSVRPGWISILPSMGPLTLTFDRLTWPFHKIAMLREAYRHGKHIKCQPFLF